ncbi:MAG: hypothetical protein A4E32_00690 [Methanomassiliicoccales archaeon PtaU1.Bin124]|nr:MAG: hypothetical protein A4E32_00690 [Methanomassiliicoccales archaeon PtaU1.Bin124]
MLRARDFRMGERDGQMLGYKGEVEVLFCLLESFDEGKLSSFLESTKSFQGKRVVATLAPLPETVIKGLPSGVIIWDREAIEHEIGRVHIEKIVGNREHGLVDEFVADDYPKMISAEDLESIGVVEVGEKIVKPVLNPDDVKEIGTRTVGGFRFRLELVPHYLYRYACSLFIDDHKLGVQEGTLAINALTHKPAEWPDQTEIVFNIDQTHQRLEPSIDVEEGRTIALDEIMARHTAERDVVRDMGSVTVTDRKKVSPHREEIVLETVGVYYLPVWCVEGVKGVIILNAGTGKVISEDYFSKDLS